MPFFLRRPFMLYILVVSIASFFDISGKIVGNRFASMLLPEPGGPSKSMLCPPQAAT